MWWYGLFEQYALGKEAARFGTLDAVLMSMPAVIYVLGLSGAIHLINYYRDAVKHGGMNGAADRAVLAIGAADLTGTFPRSSGQRSCAPRAPGVP